MKKNDLKLNMNNIFYKSNIFVTKYSYFKYKNIFLKIKKINSNKIYLKKSVVGN